MILDDIVRAKKNRLEKQKGIYTLDDMKSQALKSTRKSFSFYNGLKKEGLSIIGEFKKASPSMGVLKNSLTFEERIEKYNRSMDAISCLTEEDYFNGSVEYLKAIRKLSNLPIIRKDFIIDQYQVYEAKVIGADAILLIVAILEDGELLELYNLAYDLGLDVLVEVHDDEELQRALKIDAKIIGINNRNLKDFTITLSTTERLSKVIKEKVVISESGILKDDDVRFLRNCNVDGILVGRTFMECSNPEEVALRWKDIYQK